MAGSSRAATTTTLTARRRHRGTRPLLLALLLGLAGLAVPLAPPAPAAEGDLTVVQCFSGTAVAGCATLVPPAFNAVDAELSPDGKQLYVLGRDSGSVVRVFDRGADGLLTARPGAAGCFRLTVTGDCTAVSGMDNSDVYDLAISPDGRSLYVAANSNLVLLARDTEHGDLAPHTCYGTSAGCVVLNNLTPNVYGVVVSPDNQNVYVRGASRFNVLQRNTVTGTLIPDPDGDNCFTEIPTAGCTDTYGIRANGFEMTFTKDGQYLYYPIQDPGGIGFFLRAGDGTLTQIAGPQGGCITTNGGSSSADECVAAPTGGLAMSNSWGATMSPSEQLVFVSGLSGTSVFTRSAETGKLTWAFCVTPGPVTGCLQGKGAAGMAASVSPDGKRVAIGDYLGILGMYALDGTTGALTQLPDPMGCFSGAGTPGCTAVPATHLSHAVWAPNGRNIYYPSGKVINIAQEGPPDLSVTVRLGRGPVPLNARGKVRVKVTCPAAEASGPCSGTLRIKTRSKVLYQGGKRKVLLGTASFSVPAGKTVTVRVKLGPEKVRLVKRNPAARKVLLVAKVRDTAGNKGTVRKKAAISL